MIIGWHWVGIGFLDSHETPTKNLVGATPSICLSFTSKIGELSASHFWHFDGLIFFPEWGWFQPPTRKVPTDPGFFLPHRPRALSCSGASSIFEAFGLAGGQVGTTAGDSRCRALKKSWHRILLGCPRNLATWFPTYLQMGYMRIITH